jgi:hypothetical protein
MGIDNNRLFRIKMVILKDMCGENARLMEIQISL